MMALVYEIYAHAFEESVQPVGDVCARVIPGGSGGGGHALMQRLCSRRTWNPSQVNGPCKVTSCTTVNSTSGVH